VLPGGPLAARIETLGRRLKSVDAFLFMSSYFRLPATLAEALGNIHCDVPRFTIADVAELLAAANAPQRLRTEPTCQMLLGVAQKLPILVMAAVRYLANRNWNFTTTELESLFRGEFALAHRRDASSLLQITVPDVEERELLIRMSLAIGVFTMDDIAHVARVRKAIPLPGEKVHRATGLWLQQVGNRRYLCSPLITSGLAESLDPETRNGVHIVLALRILARKTIEPIEAFTCVNHLMIGGDVAFAVTVAIQTLAAFLELDEPVEDDFSFARMWPSRESLSAVDINLQISLRAMQVNVLVKRGLDVLPMIETLDALIEEVGGTGWGTAIAARGLAIHLIWRLPILANKYVLQALSSVADARLPDGSALPVGPHPLEQILWISAHSCKSDLEVDSWLATVSQYTPGQIRTLKSSDMMQDNVTILCDGIWLRVYRKPESERNWSPVKKKLEEVQATAHVIDLPLLEAAAVRTRIMLLAEWENQLDAALSLAELELKRFENDECRFLIMEVTGRQLFYAGKAQEAKTWLDSALSCDAYHNSVLRRNLLITMAELYASQDSRKAPEFTSQAVKVCRDGKIVEPLYIETLAEHGIALWRAGEKSQSYELLEDATNRILAIQSTANAWRGQFARLFAVIAYYSAVALNGKPQDGHVEPAQGLFLASNEQAHAGYRPEQLAYICIRLAMFADGIKDIWKAADWTWRAIEFAKENPTAWDAVRLSSWHAIPATLLSGDFARAARLVKVIAALEAESVIGTLKTRADINTNGKISELEALIGATAPEARKSILRIIPIVPVAIRLAFLRFRGATTTMTVASLTDIESVIPPNLQPENFVAEMKKALVDETDWNTLWNDGCRAFQTHEYVRGCIRCIGAVTQAPVSQSLYLQISIAQNFEKFFKTCPSLYREIVAPFFAAYWERTIAQSTGLFRTALAYTQRQVQAVDGSAEGTRRLLNAMRFCLGVKFPEQAVEWLHGSK
jgi:tetratricopeptide (TPR) repeat protein